jgi:hypothetical protein
MKRLVRYLIAIVLVVVVVVVVVGPARLVAGAEYPIGVGPWSSTGRYCQDIYRLGHLADEWHQRSLTPSEITTVMALAKTLTDTGPQVPRADFTALFRTTGTDEKRIAGDVALINTWSNQNCADLLMEAPSSLNHVWKGLTGHETFTHYPRNIIKVGDLYHVVASFRRDG